MCLRRIGVASIALQVTSALILLPSTLKPAQLAHTLLPQPLPVRIALMVITAIERLRQTLDTWPLRMASITQEALALLRDLTTSHRPTLAHLATGVRATQKLRVLQELISLSMVRQAFPPASRHQLASLLHQMEAQGSGTLLAQLVCTAKPVLAAVSGTLWLMVRQITRFCVLRARSVPRQWELSSPTVVNALPVMCALNLRQIP